MTTINDVAKRAGVAPITVSRVINNSGYISQKTRYRVEQAISELGYVPNALARGLRSKRTNTLALVMTDITNPFFTNIARGVEDIASESGFSVIFCNTDESETEEFKYAKILAQKQVDGILLVPACSQSRTVEFLKSIDIPVVLLDRRIPDVQIDTVRCDSIAGAYDLVQLLIGLGHNIICIISGQRGVSTAEDRVIGYHQAMTEAGLEENEQVYFGSFTQACGYEFTKMAFAQPTPPTAFLGANNFISIGVMKALRDQKLHVPEDVTLVGFDDLPLTLFIDEPFLTVAVQPAYEMGKKATELLLNRLLGEAPEECQEVILPIEIVQRKSSGPARV
jgi:LacI family transcriptional regulator, galactose operon repressor